MGSCIAKQSSDDKVVEPRKLQDNELQLLIDNTSYTREEIEDWHKGFIVDFFVLFHQRTSLELLNHSFFILCKNNIERQSERQNEQKRVRRRVQEFFPQSQG